MGLYAASGIREYWIVNVPERCVEVHRAPLGVEYTVVSRHARGDVLHPEAFPDVAVAVADVLIGRCGLALTRDPARPPAPSPRDGAPPASCSRA